jgi:hypothetical protein
VLQLREQLTESRKAVEQAGVRLREADKRAEAVGEELASARAGLLAAQAQVETAMSATAPATAVAAADPVELEERLAAGVAGGWSSGCESRELRR